jgi:hypothetical protein
MIFKCRNSKDRITAFYLSYHLLFFLLNETFKVVDYSIKDTTQYRRITNFDLIWVPNRAFPKFRLFFGNIFLEKVFNSKDIRCIYKRCRKSVAQVN